MVCDESCTLPCEATVMLQLLVMRLKFFKIVWHDITLLIVLTGLVDMVVMILDDSRNETAYSSSIGHTYVRICFILSRSVRLLGMVEIVPVRSVFVD